MSGEGPMQPIDAELARLARRLWVQARAVMHGEAWDETRFRAELAEAAVFGWLVAFERLHHLRASLRLRARDWKRDVDGPAR